MTTHNTTVKEETVETDTGDDQRRKDAERHSMDVVTTRVTKETVQTDSEEDRRKKDMERRSTDVVTSDSYTEEKKVITTDTTWSESFLEKHASAEPEKEWSQRIRGESDSAFRRYRTGDDEGGGHSSTSEESWGLGTERWTQRDVSTKYVSHGEADRATAGRDSPTTTLHGALRCQAVDAQQLNVSSHEEKRRFYIRAVVDPRNGFHLSVREVTTFLIGN